MNTSPSTTVTIQGQNRVAPPTLNTDQQTAVDSILSWLTDKSPSASPFYVLLGPAGTGKTFTMKVIIDSIKSRFVFTAPTNKATKVLRETFTDTGYKPDCRTIYSLLGLRLEGNGEVKELTSRELKEGDEEPLDLSKFACVVIDEGSMIPGFLLEDHIMEAHRRYGVRFLIMGDPAQLPPVKEDRSPIWKLIEPGDLLESPAPHSLLTKVMRHDNAILNFVTDIRMQVDAKLQRFSARTDYTLNPAGFEEGVWYLPKGSWMQAIKLAAEQGEFHEGKVKAIAWRNVTVDQLNRFIRTAYFPEAVSPWVEGDRVIFTSPARDLEGEPMAATDDEGKIVRVSESYHPLYPAIRTYAIDIQLDTGKLITSQVVHPSAVRDFDSEAQRLASDARINGKLWRLFWEFKDSFHSLRYAYAITAHRSQGSTYDKVFVDVGDILLNRNRQEAFRCLYVAASRPRRQLYLA